MNIHIITGEYPPDCGGVADYSCLVAAGLSAAGKSVHVWSSGNEPDSIDAQGVLVHRCCGSFDRTGLERLSAGLDAQPQPRRLIVQYVPHAFSPRAMNLRFVGWLWRRRRVQGDVVDVMFHELAYPFVRRPLKHNLIAIVNRLMLCGLLATLRRAYVSTTAWLPMLSRYSLRRVDPELCAIPTNISVVHADEQVHVLRRKFMPFETGELLGHFGTYPESIRRLLFPVLAELLERRPQLRVLLLGRSSVAHRQLLVGGRPGWEDRVTAVEDLSPDEVSLHLQTCDVLFQPYPDGATTRRSSLMAGLSHGKVTLTTSGESSEQLWLESEITPIVPVSDRPAMLRWLTELLDDPQLRSEWGQRSQAYYQIHFSIEHTLECLLEPTAGKVLDVRVG